MNSAHLHLITTHIPVLGTVFGLALLIASLWRSSYDLKRAGLWMLVLAGLAALPSYLSGEPASAILLKMMPTMPRDPGDQHAEVAVLALTAALCLAVVSLVALIVSRKKAGLPRWLTSVLLLLAIATTALMGWTSNLGGQIRHPEIRSGVPDLR